AVQILPFVEYMLQSDTLMLREHRLAAPLFPAPLACAAWAAALAGALWSVQQLVRREQRLALPALALLLCTIGGLLAGMHAGMNASFVLPLASDWFGDARTYLGPENYLERNLAFAGAALPLAAVGLLWGRPRRDARVAGWLLALGLLAGYHAPLITGVLRVLPLLRLAENARLQFLALLATALLAGWGLDALGRVPVVRRARARLLALALLPPAGVLLSLALATTYGVLPNTNVTPPLPGTLPLVAGLLTRAEAGSLSGLPPGMLELVERDIGGLPVKDFLCWFRSAEPPQQVQILWGPSLESAFATSCQVTPPLARGAAPLALGVEAVWLVHGQVPLGHTVPGATAIRLRISFTHGVVGLTAPLTSPEDIGRSALPFPAQPAPGLAGWQLSLFVLVALLAVAGLHVRGRARPPLRAGLLLLVGASLAPFTAGLLPMLPEPLFYPSSPALALLAAERPDARLLNLAPQAFPPEIPAAYGLLDVRGYDALYPARVVRLLREATDVRDNRLSSMELLPAREDVDLALLGLMSVRLLTDAETLADSPLRLRYPGENELPVTDPFPLVVNPEFLPRARLATGCAVEADDTAAIALLRSADFPRATTVVLERGTPQPAAADAQPAARIVRDDPDTLRVEIEPRAAGWLVLTDTFYPGWKALVDGVERPIERANVAFRAVAVRPGDRAVEFRFKSASVRAGALISLATGAVVAAALLLPRRRAGGRPPPCDDGSTAHATHGAAPRAGA
ncbi:MAG TPA: hypothetical protein VK824_01945, partial [Planctomycetota bacterium]|nr:hypothetical protein [Planctomycetota bacterium]